MSCDVTGFTPDERVTAGGLAVARVLIQSLPTGYSMRAYVVTALPQWSPDDEDHRSLTQLLRLSSEWLRHKLGDHSRGR